MLQMILQKQKKKTSKRVVFLGDADLTKHISISEVLHFIFIA